MAAFDDINKAKKALEDLSKEYEKLTNKKIPTFNIKDDIKEANNAITIMNDLLDKTKREMTYLEDGFGNIENTLVSIVQELKKTQTPTKNATSAFIGISKVVKDLKYDQQEIDILNKKQLNSYKTKLSKLQEEVKINAERLQIEKDMVGKSEQEILASKELTEDQKSILVGLSKNFDIFNDINNLLDKRIKEEKDYEKALGITGATVKSLSSALSKLGFGALGEKLGINDALDKAKAKAKDLVKTLGNPEVEAKREELINKITKERGFLSDKQLKAGFGGIELKKSQIELEKINAEWGNKTLKTQISTNDRLGIAKDLVKDLGTNLIENILDPELLIVKAFELFIDALKISDNSAGNLAKSFNLSYQEAVALNGKLNETANLSLDAAINTKGLNESLIAVGKSLGSNAQLNTKDLITFTKLREQAGYTNDELIDIQKLSLINNKTLEDNTASILGGAKAYASQNKLVVNEKDILREVGKTSAAVKLSLGGSADELARSVIQAKQFGLTLAQADHISSSLLDFESSISNELEAELITGKNLNLEKARQLALNNDIAGAAAEVAKQVGTSVDFAKMNRIQQESIAKAAGLTREELAQSLMDREALAKLSEVEGKTAQERFNNLVKQVGLEEAKKRLGNEQLANQFAQQSIQERFNNRVDKLKDIFVSIAEPVLAIVSPLMDLINTILPAINVLLQPIINDLKAIGVVIRDLISEPLKALKGIFSGIIDIMNGDITNGFKKIGVSLLRYVLSPFQALLDGIVTLINSFTTILNKIPGVNIGEIKAPDLTNSIVGPNVAMADGGIVTSPTHALVGEAGPEAVIPLNQLMNEFKEMKQILTAILNKEGTITLNGTKMGTAMAVGSYKIQ